MQKHNRILQYKVAFFPNYYFSFPLLVVSENGSFFEFGKERLEERSKVGSRAQVEDGIT